MKQIRLNNDLEIPALGLGTWKSEKGDARSAVLASLEIGYTHIDCAHIYKNENEIGEALSAGIKNFSLQRENLWITSKLWNNAHNPKHVRPALERTLTNLQLDYLDLYLIHWPVSFRQDIEFPSKPEEFLPPGQIPLADTWGALEKMVKKGLCRSIGVCNFSLSRLKELQQIATIQPVMNQIELHPYLQQNEMLKYSKESGVTLTAFSPLGSPDRPDALKKSDEPSLLNHPDILQIGAELGASPAQVLINWALSRGTVVIPKSVSPKRLKENFQATELNLSEGHLEILNKLDTGYRFVDGSFFCSPGSPYSLDQLW